MNKIVDLIAEIEREERVNDKDFKETLSLLYEANKHYNKELTIHGFVRSKRKSNTELFNQMNNDFMLAIIDSDNGIYDPIEEFGEELEDKYIIIEK